jgi:hypothetical protein
MLGRTVTPDDAVGRALGKTADLALGYGGSLGAWRRFNPTDDRPDGAILLNIQDWRRAHPAICRFWRAYERGCLRAILTGERVQFGTRFAFSFENGTLFAQLPSGRRIAYPKARIGPGKYEGVRQIYFHDNARGGWKEERAWFGTLVENCVQGTARDLLAVAILRLEASKYPVVLHVHDEAVCELAEGIGSEEEFSRLLTTLPDWAEGLPIAANVWAGPRYAKTTTKPAPPTVLDEPPQAVNGAPVPAELPAIAAAPEPEDMEEDVAADAIAEISLADLIGEPLTDGKILCPFHEDHTPSLHIYPNRYYCFVCGASGGHTDWLIKVERQTYPEAVQTLKAWDGPRGYIAADQGKERKERARAFALELWEQAQPIAGTLAAHYLEAVRGIDLTTLPADIDGALRFHPRCSFGSSFHPCLVALMRHPVSDAPLGIHRTALTSEGRKLERKMLGGAGVVKMWPAGAQLVIGEGLETVLAAATRIPYEDAPLRPAWATLSALGLAQFPLLNSVKRLIILIDHDEEGECAAYACTERWRRCGRAVVQLKPDEPGTDFNDLILPE